MTMDGVEDGIRLPRWALEIIILVATAGIGGAAVHFVDTVQFTQKIEDRVSALEKQDIDILARQETNTNARIALEVKMDTVISQHAEMEKELRQILTALDGRVKP